MEQHRFEVPNLPVIQKFFSGLKPINLNKGEMIFRPDLPNANVFYIDNGFIKTYNISETGDEKIVMFYKNHDIFPLIRLFKNAPKDVYAETVSITTVRSVNELEFKKFLDSTPEAMNEFIGYLLGYVEIYSQRVKNLGFMTAFPKIIYCLVSLGKRFGMINNKNRNIKVEIPITQRELAATIAMTRETVSREFEKLVKEDIVILEDHGIVIKNMEKLEKLLDKYGDG
jgi:CRP/FNR family transcriptional regulator